MIPVPVSEMISLMKAFCVLHDMAGRAMHPAYARTVAAILGECEESILQMERLSPPREERAEAEKAENIIHVNFNRPAPPSDGGDAA